MIKAEIHQPVLDTGNSNEIRHSLHPQSWPRSRRADWQCRTNKDSNTNQHMFPEQLLLLVGALEECKWQYLYLKELITKQFKTVKQKAFCF